MSSYPDTVLENDEPLSRGSADVQKPFTLDVLLVRVREIPGPVPDETALAG